MLTLLAQGNGNGNDVAAGGAAAAMAGCGCFMFIVYLALIVLIVIGFWKTFTKAGQPGWASIIPILNVIILLQIAGKPIWWIVLLLIPGVNLVVMILVCIEIAKRFGHGAGFGIGLALLGSIFFPILGFGSSQYQGPPVDSILKPATP